MSLPCSERLEWVVRLEIYAAFIGWKLEFWSKWERMEDKPGSSHLEGELWDYAMRTPVWSLHNTPRSCANSAPTLCASHTVMELRPMIYLGRSAPQRWLEKPPGRAR